MQLSDFSFNLDEKFIAQEQVSPKDHAKLMLINRATGSVSHHHIYDLPELLLSDYFIVANNTKVFPARLIGNKSTGGKIEVLLTKPLGHSKYLCIGRPGLKVGEELIFSSSLSAKVLSINEIERTIQFNINEADLRTSLSQLGTMPTPPYIKKMLKDAKDYQTIYAKYGFSAAAPTAGLHFTPSLLDNITRSHSWHELTLNVGLGTFLPVKVDDISTHHMHHEDYTISQPTADAINKQRTVLCKKLLSIGTTTMRALESNTKMSQKLSPGSYSTDIFIYPPYEFKITDALMTNFHLPGSTLLMLVSAFCTYPQTKLKFTNFKDSLLGKAYHEAIKNNYRFFSFGDAMLIL